MRSVKCNSTKQIWRLVARVDHVPKRAPRWPPRTITHHMPLII